MKKLPKITTRRNQIILLAGIGALLVFTTVFFPIYYWNISARKSEMEPLSTTIEKVEIVDKFEECDFKLLIAVGYKGNYYEYPSEIEGTTIQTYTRAIILHDCYAEIMENNMYEIEFTLKLKKEYSLKSSKFIFETHTNGLGYGYWSEECWFEEFGGALKIYFSCATYI